MPKVLASSCVTSDFVRTIPAERIGARALSSLLFYTRRTRTRRRTGCPSRLGASLHPRGVPMPRAVARLVSVRYRSNRETAPFVVVRHCACGKTGRRDRPAHVKLRPSLRVRQNLFAARRFDSGDPLCADRASASGRSRPGVIRRRHRCPFLEDPQARHDSTAGAPDGGRRVSRHRSHSPVIGRVSGASHRQPLLYTRWNEPSQRDQRRSACLGIVRYPGPESR